MLIWHSNPSYTSIPYAHYITEARYHGRRVVCIAPDYSPSALWPTPTCRSRSATDAAFALAMCQVILEEGLDEQRVRPEVADGLAAARASRTRAASCAASDVVSGEREDQFYWWDEKTDSLVEAPRGTLELEDVLPALSRQIHGQPR